MKVVTLATLITVVRLLIIVVITVLQLQHTRDTLRGGNDVLCFNQNGQRPKSACVPLAAISAPPFCF